jgi:hypothetical protein
MSVTTPFPAQAQPASTERAVSSVEARELILSGRATSGMRVAGHLDFSDNQGLTWLPDDLRVRRLTLTGCRRLRELPAGLHCYELEMGHTVVVWLPADITVEYRLNLEGCTRLQTLPTGLTTGSLVLRSCTSLQALPEGMDVYFLDIAGCTSLTGWPRRASVHVGHVDAAGCTGLTTLPPWLRAVAQLNLSECAGICDLPEGLTVRSWLDLANTGIRSLPASLHGVQLRWHGVPIDERIAFRPQTITAREVLDQQNAELRRVLLERMGYEAFLAEASARVLDRDRDAGGERRLLRVPLRGDEDLVCLAVYCPSTGRQYILRVPPSMHTCRQAAAWIAGYDNASDYQPIQET